LGKLGPAGKIGSYPERIFGKLMNFSSKHDSGLKLKSNSLGRIVPGVVTVWLGRGDKKGCQWAGGRRKRGKWQTDHVSSSILDLMVNKMEVS